MENIPIKKYSLGVLLIILITLGSVWIYNWYTGKVSPSIADTVTVTKEQEVAYFAGGCFWCTESDFEKIDGVMEVASGYMGGDVENPSYNQVSSGESGHREVVRVVYNPEEVSYRQLAFALLRETDPTDAGGSFYDRGHQYTSAIYYQNENEQRDAQEVIAIVEDAKVFNVPIVTSVEKASTFWLAEEYHQDYYKKNPLPYAYYRKGSGRDDFIDSKWGSGEFDDLLNETEVSNMTETTSKWESFEKPSDTELLRSLNPIQYYVTQKEGTETPFNNEYWDNHEEGIYVDVVSGEPLFSSTDKFDSGTGWPSFLKPLDEKFVVEKEDYKLIIPRIEIRSAIADSHLGHIIMDGPVENDGIRYCMNSAALRFVPKAELKENGLEKYIDLFD